VKHGALSRQQAAAAVAAARVMLLIRQEPKELMAPDIQDRQRELLEDRQEVDILQRQAGQAAAEDIRQLRYLIHC
jgi:hypothetical protein